MALVGHTDAKPEWWESGNADITSDEHEGIASQIGNTQNKPAHVCSVETLKQYCVTVTCGVRVVVLQASPSTVRVTLAQLALTPSHLPLGPVGVWSSDPGASIYGYVKRQKSSENAERLHTVYAVT